METRILMIDDEVDLTHLVKMLLESTEQYIVEEENVATNAMATARKFRPDLILLDIMMPDLDGSELAAQFQADPQLRNIPIVFLTALVSKTETRDGTWFASGGRTYVPKSAAMDLEQLVDCIEGKLATSR